MSFDKLSGPAREVMNYAAALAAANGRPVYGSLEVLAGIVQNGVGHAGGALRALGKLDEVRAATKRTLDSAVKSVPVATSTPSMYLENAVLTAGQGSRTVYTDSILICLLLDAGCSASEILRECGVTPQAIRDECNKDRSRNSEPVAPRMPEEAKEPSWMDSFRKIAEDVARELKKANEAAGKAPEPYLGILGELGKAKPKEDRLEEFLNDVQACNVAAVEDVLVAHGLKLELAVFDRKDEKRFVTLKILV